MNRLRLWNLKAKLYRSFRNRFPFGFILQQENESLLLLLKKIPSNFKTVLDLGTGEGNVLQLIADNAKKIGVDSCLSMIINARKNINADFINCELLYLSLKNQSADIVLLIGVLEYFSKLDPLFCEIYRITKSDARVIISYSPNNIWAFLRQFLGHKIYPLSLEKIIKIIEKNGFQLITHNKLMMQHQIIIKKINVTLL